MAKIPLRAYNREIENLINRGQIDEAVGHCKHILRFFPKHVDTYRLLGKAFLEGQHYAEASDVLQRVLSCVPDDFISQVGMSIIREDEGNLDAAIWHMERAFEVQPANTAVQGEMRRLYGRRDGVEPPKVRLTRGALVRMYARGELYQQAIAEIRSALAEDPKRIDIEVILARMYFLSGMKVEATEVCSRIISKLPFCYEANRILAEILPETARAEDAKVYQQRVDAMEPYAAYISKNTPTLEDVPDNVVTLDRLEWQASDATPQKPEWARTVGIEWEEQQESLPEWMASAPEALSGEQPAAENVPSLPDSAQVKTGQTSPLQQEPEIAEAGQNEIPDWMQAAGWGKSTGPEVPPSADAFTEDESPTGEIAGGDIPDWLRAMAPKDASEETAQPEDQNRLDLLSNLLPENSPAADNKEQTNESAPIPAFDAEMPDWLKTEDSASEAQPFASTGDAAPDWLKTEDGSNAAHPFAATGDETPDWLKSIAASDDETEPAAVDGEMPAWLQSEAGEMPKAVSTQEMPASPVQPQDRTAQNEVPESTATSPSDQQPATAPSSENPDDAFAWLEALAAHQGADEETLLTKPEERIETPPDWLQQAGQAEAAASAIPESAAQPVAEAGDTTENLENEVPDWLKELQSEPSAAETTEPAAAFPKESIPAEPVEQPVDEQPETTPATGNEEIPDWLKSMQAEAGETPDQGEVSAVAENIIPPAEEAQPEEKPVSETAAPEPATADEDSAFAWLESLAARQGADEETLLVKPEERKETPPDWVQQQIPESAAEAAPESTALPAETMPEMAAGKESAAEELPDWLKSLPEDSETNKTNEEAVPDWLKETGAVAKAEEVPGEEIPDWLRSSEAQAEETPALSVETPAVAPEEETMIETPVAETPAETPVEESALEPAAAETTSEAPQAEKEVAASAEDDAFAWLESLAAKQGAAEEELLLKPEERAEKPPEWVAATPAETPVEESPIEPAAAETASEAPLAEKEVAASAEDDAFAWLESLAAKQGAAEEELLLKPEDRAEKPPEWVSETPAETPVEEPPVEPAAAETTIEAPQAEKEVAAPAEDDAFAWLESLAAKQGAAEEELLLKPEDRAEKPPEWVGEEAAAQPAAASEPAPVTDQFDLSEPAAEETLSAEAPEELLHEEAKEEAVETPAEEAPAGETTEEEVSEEDVPDWLKDLEISQEETNAALDIAFGQAVPVQKSPTPETEAVDAWLQELPETHAPVEEPQKPAGDSLSEITHPVSVAKAPESAPAPKAAPAPVPEVSIEVQTVLGRARTSMYHGKVAEAVHDYLSLIKYNKALDETIQDLKDALYQHPVDIDLWQTIGDAYAHANRLQDALDSYTKAEELLR